MIKFKLKITRPWLEVEIEEFQSQIHLDEWLRDKGFYSSNGIHCHLDGSIAGQMSSIGCPIVDNNCDRPLRSVGGLFWIS